MSFRLDWKNFRKTATENGIATLKHSRGHEIRIALKSLPPGTRKLLEELPVHMADGGKVADKKSGLIEEEVIEQPEPIASTMPAAPVQEPDTIEKIQQDVAATPPNPYAALYEETLKSKMQSNPRAKGANFEERAKEEALAYVEHQKAMDEAKVAAEEQQKAQAAQKQADAAARMQALGIKQPAGTAAAPQETSPDKAAIPPQGIADQQVPGTSLIGAYGQNMQQGFDLQKKAIGQEQAAYAALSKEQAEIAGQQAAQAKVHMETMQAVQQDMARERQAFMHDVQKGHINPNRIFENQSAGQKVMSAIGLLLVGAGGGMSGVPGAAQKFLDAQIDRDVRAQQANIDNRSSLYKLNLDHYKNQMDALNATRINVNDYYIHLLEQAKAKNLAPQAQAAASAKMGDLMTKNAGLQAQMGSQPRDMNDSLAFLEKTNPEKAKELKATMVPGMGFASTPEDAKALKEMNQDAISARQSIARLQAINGKTGKSLSPSLRTEANSIAKALVGQLNRAFTGGGPMSQGEQELLASIARDPTSLFSLDSSNKQALDTLLKTLDNKVNAAAQARGVNSPGASKSPQGSQPKTFKADK